MMPIVNTEPGQLSFSRFKGLGGLAGKTKERPVGRSTLDSVPFPLSRFFGGSRWQKFVTAAQDIDRNRHADDDEGQQGQFHEQRSKSFRIGALDAGAFGRNDEHAADGGD